MPNRTSRIRQQPAHCGGRRVARPGGAASCAGRRWEELRLSRRRPGVRLWWRTGRLRPRPRLLQRQIGSAWQCPADTTTTPSPEGLPSNWSTLAIQAAQTALETCAKSTTLDPQNCPQQNQSADLSGRHRVRPVESGGQPMAGSAAVPADAAQGGTPGQVDVYGRYLMEVSYSVSGGSVRPVLDHSGGVAHASMTWDGSSFQNVQFIVQPQDSLPPGVTVPPFPRPNPGNRRHGHCGGQGRLHRLRHDEGAADNFDIPNCPMEIGTPLDTTSAQWGLQGDPTSGAIVSFDTNHGVFTVTASYQMQIHYVVNVTGDPGAANNGAPHRHRERELHRHLDLGRPATATAQYRNGLNRKMHRLRKHGMANQANRTNYRMSHRTTTRGGWSGRLNRRG